MTAVSANRRVLQEHRLDLRGRHLVALVFDELLDAIDEDDVAVGVGAADVARVQPAVGVDRARGRLGVVEVAAHHLRAAHAHLALLAWIELGAAAHVDQLALGVGDGRPDRARAVTARMQRGDVRDRARLRHAVALDDGAAHARRGRLGQLQRSAVRRPS